MHRPRSTKGAPGVWNAILYYVGLAAAMMVVTLYFLYNTLEMTWAHMIEMAAGDAAVLMSLYWLNPRRSRGAMTVWFWIMTFFLWGNTLYMRYWGDIIPFSAISSTASYNPLVFKSIPTLLRFQDAIYVAMLTAVTVMWYKMRGNNGPTISWPLRLTALAITWLFGAGCTGLLALHYYRYVNTLGAASVSYEKVLKERITCPERSTQTWCLNNQGVTIYLIDNIISSFKKPTIELTSEERAQIDTFIQSRLNEANGLQLKGNEKKNLIFIIVESLNANYIGKIVGGEDLTPVLSSLIGRQGTVYALNMETQIKAGGSSDGQFIYNTGLLPLSTGCVALTFGNGTYQTFAKALNREYSILIDASTKATWNLTNTSTAYGYDTLLDCQDLANAGFDGKTLGGDGALFQYSLETLKDVEQPFVATLQTISMHYPFEDAKEHFDLRITDEMVSGELERRYCESLLYFDSQLGKFINGLKKAGMMDNTVIVIASDHDQSTKEAEGKLHEPIAFIAVNTGKTMHVEAQCYQADAYPTILDIMGVAPTTWRGVGHSLFAPEKHDENIQMELSQKIIRGEYFKE